MKNSNVEASLQKWVLWKTDLGTEELESKSTIDFKNDLKNVR